MNQCNIISEGFTEISTGKIHYIECGKGEDAHFLHANGFCAGVYTPFLNYLADDLHIIASDIKGHGDSDAPLYKKIPHWAVFARDLKEFIEKKMNPPVTGIGHSLGGTITFIAAAEYPYLFKHIILIDPVIFPPQFLRINRILRLIGFHKKFSLAQGARRRKHEFASKDEAYDRYSKGNGIFATWPSDFLKAYINYGLKINDKNRAELKCSPDTEAGFFESFPLDIWKYAGKIQCPVLAIRGEHSDTFLPSAANRMKRVIKDSKISIIKDTGHFIPVKKPEELALEIKKFVNHR